MTLEPAVRSTPGVEPARQGELQRRGSTTVATLRAIYIIWYRDTIRYLRDRFRLIASLMQPLLYLLIFGTGLSSSLRGGGGFGGAGLDYKQFLYGGVIGMSILFIAIFSAMSIVWDREFGFLKEVLVAPINRSAVAIGKTLGGATQAFIQGAILLMLSPLAGVKLTVIGVLELVPLMFLLAFSLSAMGTALGSRMRSMQGFQGVMNFLMMPLFFLSGALFPLAGLPAWMTVLTRLDPVAYGIDPIRRVVLENSGVPQALVDRLGMTWFDRPLGAWQEAGLVLVFGLVMLGIAIVNFRARD
jgi:ABC-2 type transport system permease protein